MKNGTITTRDDRTVGFADYGTSDQIALLWCHGGPGNRLEPSLVADSARRAGLRVIGIDLPGYGLSTPQPGRTIGGWVEDAIAVVDHLGIERFAAVGLSTGGAYALALAAHTDRVIAALACGAVSDMRWQEGKAMNVACHPFWNAHDRAEAMSLASLAFGERGAQILPQPAVLDAPDRAWLATPEPQAWWASCVPEMFTQGVSGYVDDRLADASGWWSFDVSRITCPVTVLHGSEDGLMPVANAHHTAAIVPGATLHIVEGVGHLSLLPKLVEVTADLLSRAVARR